MPPKTFAQKAIAFYKNLNFNHELPHEVEVMNPYTDKRVMEIVKKFFTRFFSDDEKRIFIWGINPGRFGAGVTGIAFTDPVALRDYCKIENNLGDKRELSSRFVYDVIKTYGDLENFYKKFFFTALSPLGFTKKGINYNYYDDKELMQSVTPFIVENIKQQLKLGAVTRDAICLGTGKNYKFFEKLNKEHQFFENIHPIDHPRYIMQYKLKSKDFYIKKYLELLQTVD